MSSMDIDPQDGQGNTTGNGVRGRRNPTRGRGGFKGRQSRFQSTPRAPAGEWGHDMYQLTDIGAQDASTNKIRSKRKSESISSKSSALAANSFAARIGKAPTSKAQKAINGLAATAGRPTNKEAIRKQLADNPLFAALQGDRSQQKKAKVAIKGSSEKKPERKFEIKGSGGKTYVRISNLAIGTTEDDVRTFLGRLGAGIEGCKTFMDKGAIAAEVLFTDRSTADMCVSQIDNAFADGRIIHAAVTSGSELKGTTSEPKTAMVTNQNGSHGVRSALYSDAMVQRGRGFKGQR
ncbi:hypothetical protein V1525DRAFT_402701 [Lipomyces kononenkoae]|uniref:Uncharacterized protein n=1 Tax=Lipomyces kononenkoae TaxID=34357 RepID=A0ACC3T1W6_LIPKO